jgi:uncharacterized protein (TIGR00725 family)
MTSKASERNWIAVLGGAIRYSDEQVIAAYQIGREVARRGKSLVTGATTGIPYAAAIGAKHGGGTVVGISPASSPREHVTSCKKPLDYLDFVIYSGMGVEGRGPLIVRSVASAIFIGGEFGTLNEFSVATLCGTSVLGVLRGCGGISDSIEEIVRETRIPSTSVIVLGANPVELVQSVCEEVDRRCGGVINAVSSEDVGKDVREIVARFLGEGEIRCAS